MSFLRLSRQDHVGALSLAELKRLPTDYILSCFVMNPLYLYQTMAEIGELAKSN